ncbi:MAG: hypothetical protein AAGA12_07395 [Pseudomonadota bacterium]
MDFAHYLIWFAAALVLGILEVLIPGYILLGFALAAGVMGLIFLAGGPFAAYLSASFPITLVVFALVALAAWLILRRVFSLKRGQVKVWDKDINDH